MQASRGVQCNICLEEEDNEIGELDCCTHAFCFPCINRWSETENRCPTCRSRFRVISRKRLALATRGGGPAAGSSSSSMPPMGRSDEEGEAAALGEDLPPAAKRHCGDVIETIQVVQGRAPVLTVLCFVYNLFGAEGLSNGYPMPLLYNHTPFGPPCLEPHSGPLVS